jgi:hypothetical protein
MVLEIADQVVVVWDDPLPDGTEVQGEVVGWLARQDRSVPAAVVALNVQLTAEGAVPGSDRRDTQTGSFLVISPRYVGQVWDNEGTVQANLHREKPEHPTSPPGLWVASHGVYRRRQT